eukprot:SAG22_NODE_14182_length_382_cov_0.915194_1_plen_58_part_00
MAAAIEQLGGAAAVQAAGGGGNPKAGLGKPMGGLMKANKGKLDGKLARAVAERLLQA